MTYSIPTPQQMHQVLDQFLNRWGHLSAQYVATPMEEVSSLSLEQSIYFSEPMEGLLVNRSKREFDQFLEKECNGSFLEISVLFYYHLFQEAWQLDTRKLKPALFKNSTPMDWPDRKAEVICTVFVKDFPLEMRLWIPVSALEMKTWLKKRE